MFYHYWAYVFLNRKVSTKKNQKFYQAQIQANKTTYRNIHHIHIIFKYFKISSEKLSKGLAKWGRRSDTYLTWVFSLLRNIEKQ